MVLNVVCTVLIFCITDSQMIHLFMNIPYNDVELLTLTPYSMNTDLTWFLTPYPPFSVNMRYSGNMGIYYYLLLLIRDPNCDKRC